MDLVLRLLLEIGFCFMTGGLGTLIKEQSTAAAVSSEFPFCGPTRGHIRIPRYTISDWQARSDVSFEPDYTRTPIRPVAISVVAQRRSRLSQALRRSASPSFS